MGWQIFVTTTEFAVLFKRLETKMGALADQVTGIADQLDKAMGEITALKDNQGKLDDADMAVVGRLRDLAQRFDDIVPDAPSAGGAPSAEPPAEPTA